MNTYNGWTNYATWRVNLEVFDGFDPREHFWDFDDNDACAGDLAENLKTYAEDFIIYNNESAAHSLMADYARAFLSDVNWREIARNLIDNHLENYEQNDDLATDDTRSYGTRNREQEEA